MSLIIMIALLPAPALAADERRLSEAEVEQILDKAAQKREAPTILAVAPIAKETAPAHPIEGEVGVSIGSGGYREAFGTAVVPLGDDGLAILSFDTVDFGSRYSRRHR